jgi:hypothetical protein
MVINDKSYGSCKSLFQWLISKQQVFKKPLTWMANLIKILLLWVIDQYKVCGMIDSSDKETLGNYVLKIAHCFSIIV